MALLNPFNYFDRQIMKLNVAEKVYGAKHSIARKTQPKKAVKKETEKIFNEVEQFKTQLNKDIKAELENDTKLEESIEKIEVEVILPEEAKVIQFPKDKKEESISEEPVKSDLSSVKIPKEYFIEDEPAFIRNEKLEKLNKYKTTYEETGMGEDLFLILAQEILGEKKEIYIQEDIYMELKRRNIISNYKDYKDLCKAAKGLIVGGIDRKNTSTNEIEYVVCSIPSYLFNYVDVKGPTQLNTKLQNILADENSKDMYDAIEFNKVTNLQQKGAKK